MQQIHRLKTWPKHFQAIFEDRKRFEFRYNDRDFHAGDFLVLQEFRPAPSYPQDKAGDYTGRWAFAEVTYVLREDEDQPEFVPDGWVILSILVHSKGVGADTHSAGPTEVGGDLLI